MTKAYIGYWWLPGHEKNSIPGTLTIHNNGDYILQLLDTFKSGSVIVNFRTIREFELIIGIAREEDSNYDYSFKLLNSIVVSNSLNKLTYYKLHASFILKSVSSELSDTLKFDSIILDPQFLNEWIDTNSFDISYPNEQNNKLHNFSLRYKQPEPIILFENQDFTLKLLTVISYKHPTNSHFNCSQSAFLKLEFLEQKSLTEIRETSKKIRNFFTLAIGTPIKIRRISVGWQNSEGVYFDYLWKDKFQNNFNNPIKIHNSMQMLLGYDFLKDNVHQVFQNWFDKYDDLKFTINNFFGTLYNDFLYTEDKFLNYVFGLEVYHRTKYGGFNHKNENYLKIRKEILDQIHNKRHIQWLESRLRKHTENSLKQRLEHLFEVHNQSLNGLVDDVEKFIDNVVETRHFHVHEKVQNKELVITDVIELSRMTKKLRVVIQAILMFELGFDHEVINKQLHITFHNSLIFDNNND
ncbi:ApeA N-terminal domain 1-containing protein [Gelidibacter pelagius]|uniref:ApeA N-terminal domain-containing protein n=1 Tax=Gelidibacter pelagius TaxID=2819985 RepID=A0ABS3SQ76_9FLAO|nr:HEPN domain-containing protein [Gelidibacter pelagius]MBO3097606.1 hypothetical protein [Gelidibacter pelagius]